MRSTVALVPSSGFGLPNSRSLTSAYFLCFSSRSLAARAWRSINSRSFLARSSSSLSLSSWPANFGGGLRDSSFSAGLNSEFVGGADFDATINGCSCGVSLNRVSSQDAGTYSSRKKGGLYAASQSFFCSSACFARRSALDNLAGFGGSACSASCFYAAHIFFNRGARDAEGVALTSAIVSQSSSQADAILRMYGQELVRRGPAKAGGAVCERWVAFETPLRRRTSHETSA